MESGGWGVDLFFVLSGFLITGILLQTKSAVNRVQSFYGRRVLRIFPIYYLVIVLVLFAAPHLAWLKQGANLQNLTDHLAYVFYFQNLIPFWHHGNYPESFLGHLWSLAVEEQFYLVWPFLVWRLAPKAIVKLCAAALLLSLLLRVTLIPHFGSGIWLYSFTLTRADGLYVGSALAVVFALKKHLPRTLSLVLAAAGCAILAAIAAVGPVSQLWLTGPAMSMFGITAVALVCGSLVGFSLEFENSAMAWVFRQPWLRSFGQYSYGMYVWHFLIYWAAQHILLQQFLFSIPLPMSYAVAYLLLLVGLTYGAGYVSFHAYEQWFLRLKNRFEPVFGGLQPAVQEPVAVSTGLASGLIGAGANS